MNTVRFALLCGACASVLFAATVGRSQNRGDAPTSAPATAPVGRGGRGGPGFAAGPADVSAENIQTLHGFKVEVLLKADPQKHGSWISMAKDDHGRLLLGGQRNQPLTRLTVV